MWKELGRATIVVLACGLLVGPNVHGERKRLTKPSERKFDVEPSKFVLVPRLHFGYLIGKAADDLERFTDDKTDKLLIAAGATLEYHFMNNWAAQVSVHRGWKDLPLGAPTITSWSWGGGVQFRLAPGARRTPFLRTEIGRISAGTDSDEQLDYDYMRLGIGIFEYTGPTTSLRLELFYRRVLSEEKEPVRVDYDVEYIGFDLGLGINL